MSKQHIIRYEPLIVLFFGLFSSLFSQDAEYQVIQLPSQIRFSTCILNDSTVIAGSDVSVAWMWKNGVLTYLPDLGGGDNQVYDINNSSLIVGMVRDSYGNAHAASWSNGTLNLLNSPSDFNARSAYSLNSAGIIVGFGEPVINPNQTWYPFIYGGSMTVFPDLQEHWFNNINDNNYIAGSWYDSTVNHTVAFIYHDGSFNFLEPPLTEAIFINDSNHVLCRGQDGEGYLLKDGNIIPISIGASDMNDHDVIAGSQIQGSEFYAAIWDNGEIIKIDSLIDPSLGIHLSIAQNINNKGEIICKASDGFLYLVLPDTSKIIKPSEDEIWIAGEQDTIKWKNVWDDKNLIIDYSSDAGNTWWMIASGVSGSSRAYAWDIPQGILSTKCFVKLKDYATGETLAVSDTFKIKPYILTRTDPSTGNFIAYNIDSDRWGFENDSADVWPNWWYERFDYEGIDTFTGREYPQWIGDSTFFNAFGFYYPDWLSFARAFSVAACYRNVTQGIYNIRAVQKWGSEAEEWGGSCFGIAGTNALAFMYRDEFHNKFPLFPNFVNPVSVTPDSGVINAMAEIFSHQFGNPTQTNDISGNIKTANQTLRNIKNMFRKSNNEVRTISLFNQSGDGAHTILPYKLQKDPSDGHYYYLSVYDNSYSIVPNTKIKFDTTANGNTGSWEPMYGWANWGGNYGIYLEVTSDKYLNYAEFEAGMNKATGIDLATNKIEVIYSRGNDIIIKNSLNQQIGHLNGQLINEMPGSFPMRIKNGSETPPYGYSLTEDNFTIETSNFSKPKISLDIFTGDKIFTISRQGTASGEVDKVYYSTDPRIGISNSHSSSIKKYKFSEIISNEQQDKMFILRKLDMEANDSLDFVNPENDQLKITNIGSGKEYEIELQYADNQKLRRFLNSSINLPSTSNHTLIPDWTDINQIPLTILVDLGNDGTIDDTLEIVNQVMGVGEDESWLIPKDYRLEQNYPNPFNPSTKISWQSPVGSRQTIKVYDLLGNEIATLVDEYKPAGTYEVAWYAENLPSGVYFYQLKAGQFVHTKKMLLLK